MANSCRKADEPRSTEVAESSCRATNSQTAGDRRVRDALEDDDVREALKLLRLRNKRQGGTPA